MKPVLLTNGLICDDDFRYVGTIVIHDGQILRVDFGETDISTVDTGVYDLVDCRGRYILPGAIDEHVHFRDPGMTDRGDIRTESRAAIAGGVTTFFDMPNTRPATTTLDAWEHKMQRAADVSAANYAFFLGATATNLQEILDADPTRVPGVKLFLGSSTGAMLLDDPQALHRLFTEFRGVIACHAEAEAEISLNRDRLLAENAATAPLPVSLHHLLRSRQACIRATTAMVTLAKETRARLHVLHVSTADELRFFSPGPVAHKRITAETCPHYLYFNHQSVERTGGLTKCNPSLKEENDRLALLKAVADGRIDVIASDHAPHLLAQKQGDLFSAASGMPSVQFILPLMLQLSRKGYFPLETVVDRMCHAPATLYNISRRGYLRRGYMADIVVINPQADYIISNADVVSTCGWTPYEGMHLDFAVEQTWVNGVCAWRDGSFTGLQTSLPVRFNQ